MTWISYYYHNDDWFLTNRAMVVGAESVATPDSWVGKSDARHDRTTDRIKAGVLFPYQPAAGIYRCPADKTRVSAGRGTGEPKRAHRYQDAEDMARDLKRFVSRRRRGRSRYAS